MVPEIWRTTDIVFCHSEPFFALLPPYGPRKSKFWKNEKTTQDIILLQMCTINDSHMMYGSWDMECNTQNLFVILDHFWPFTSLPNNLKNQYFEKMKKNPGDIIILHRCNINDNHIMSGSWDTKPDRQNFLSF